MRRVPFFYPRVIDNPDDAHFFAKRSAQRATRLGIIYADMLAKDGFKKGKILDIGSGSGDTLIEMAESGMVRVHPVGKRKEYCVDRKRWWAFFGNDGGASYEWPDWRALTRALTRLWREMELLQVQNATEYVFASRLRQTVLSMQEDFVSSGMALGVEARHEPLSDDYVPTLLDQIRRVLASESPAQP